MTVEALPRDGHWLPADSEILRAHLAGDTLRLVLSAAQVEVMGTAGRRLTGHASGLTLVCEGLDAASLAALPPVGELMGRVADGRLQVGGAWHRRWPLHARLHAPLDAELRGPLHAPPADAAGAPVRLQWQLAHRTELDVCCARAWLDGLDGARFHPSLAC